MNVSIMYLRTTSRKNRDGSTITYYQLAHNERHPKTRKPVAKIIHSFGRADKLDANQLVRLCTSIARVCGVQVIVPLQESDAGKQSQAVGLPKDLKLIGTRTLGTVWAIDMIMRLISKKNFSSILPTY